MDRTFRLRMTGLALAAALCMATPAVAQLRQCTNTCNQSAIHSSSTVQQERTPSPKLSLMVTDRTSMVAIRPDPANDIAECRTFLANASTARAPAKVPPGAMKPPAERPYPPSAAQIRAAFMQYCTKVVRKAEASANPRKVVYINPRAR